jgi:glucokinase
MVHHTIKPLALMLASAQTNQITQGAAMVQSRPALKTQRQPTNLLVIGVDLGGTQTRTAVVRGADVIARVSHPTPAEGGPEAVFETITKAIDEVLSMAQMSITGIGGIGISAPGPLDPQTGIVFDAPNLHGWHDVPLGEAIAKRFPVPVYVGHDATLAGLAEHRFGAGRGAHHMIYMTVSTGIGGGIIVDDAIVDGAGGTAGEIGHQYIDMRPDAPTCGIGHVGCLEALGSGTAIARDANALIALGKGVGIFAVHQELLAADAAQEALSGTHNQPTHVTARDVVEAAERGDAEALAIIHAAARAVGIGCVNLLHILNPSVIVLGGGVSKAGPLLFAPILQVIQQRAFKRPADLVEIVPSQLGDDGGLIGSAAYVTYRQERG